MPDKHYTWLTEGLHTDDFDTFMPMGSKETQIDTKGGEVIFNVYSSGVGCYKPADTRGSTLSILKAR